MFIAMKSLKGQHCLCQLPMDCSKHCGGEGGRNGFYNKKLGKIQGIWWNTVRLSKTALNDMINGLPHAQWSVSNQRSDVVVALICIKQDIYFV